MSYKISGTEVINDSRKGIFTSANVGSFTPSNRPTSGISAGDIIYNSDTKELEVYDGSSWLGAGGGGGKSPHATGGNVINTPTGYTHIFYTSGPIRWKKSSTGSQPMVFKSQIVGGGGGGGGSTGAGGGGSGQYAIWTSEVPYIDGTTSSGYITIGAGGAGGANTVGSDGSFTSHYKHSIAGAGGGGGGGSPAAAAGRPGTTQPGFQISGSGGGGCAYQLPQPGVEGGSCPNPGSNPQRQEFQNVGGGGFFQWWANPSYGAYYTGGGGGGAGINGQGPEPSPVTNPSKTYPGGAGRSIQFGYAHTGYVAWGGGGGCNDVPGQPNGGGNTPSTGGTGAPSTHSRGGVEAIRLGPAAGKLVMNGQYGTGSGGGGAGQHPAPGGNGASGVYILSYPIDYKNYDDAMNPGMY